MTKSSKSITNKPVTRLNLVRNFSITGIIGMLVVALVLGFYFRDMATKGLITLGENKNVALTAMFAKLTWPKFSPYFNELSEHSAEQIRENTHIKRLEDVIHAQTFGLNILKVKIYNLKGMTIFSTDAQQIGKDKGKSKGFLSAKAGQVVSELVFRDTFYGLEGVVSDRDLITSYMPLRNDQSGEIEAVFELYSDVTDVLDEIIKMEQQVYIVIVLILTCLFVVLFLTIKRADRLLRTYHEDLFEHQEFIQQQALHDTLTGLPNRRLFHDRLQQAVAEADRNEKLLGIMFVDLDRFKTINDSLGHIIGDSILREVATRLKNSVRACDTVARMGGDEFMVLIQGMNHIDDSTNTARRIIRNMGEAICLQEHELFITPSIGITVYPFDDKDIDSLIKDADTAMYRAKISGRNTFKYFSASMSAHADNALSIENRLRRALERQEFVLYYQPVIDLKTRMLIGAEALIRWNDPVQGLVAPMEFIPLLEETGLILPVGKWVLSSACQQLAQWHKLGHHSLSVNVNVSVRQFQQTDFVAMIAETIEGAGIDARHLDLEITESLLVDNMDKSIRLLNELNDMGVQLSIDDFGTGYSSLSYLKRMPIQTLKIDRSFIKDMATNQDDIAIVDAICALAKSLKLKVIAEGVESSEQLNILSRKDIGYIQGYIIDRPLTVQDFASKLRKNGLKAWLPEGNLNSALKKQA